MRKRIGIDCRLWNETGVGRYIRNLVKEIALVDSENDYVLFLRKEEYDSLPLPSRNFKKRLANIRWHTVAEQIQFKKILEKEHLDLVHFPYFSYPVGYKGKFVITIHDLIIDHFPTGKASTLPSVFYFIKQFGYRFVLQKAIANAKKIITVSSSTKQELVDHYHPNPEDVIITYEGIDENISPGKKEKVTVKKPYFLSVGNSYPHKNLDRLVEAFEIMYKQSSDTHLIFVGKKDYFSERLEKLVKDKNLSHVIHFYRNVSDSQLAYLYAHALALIVPSLMEGFGLPALEAMRNNCLVVASEIPAFLEVCKDSAVYFDPYDITDIAKKLLMTYNHTIEHILEKKKQGLLRTKQFSWKKMAQETVIVYNSCL